MSDESDTGWEHQYGFSWGPIDVRRMASIKRDGGLGRVLGIYRRKGAGPVIDLEIYISPTGRSIRVFRGKDELLPAPPVAPEGENDG